MLWTDILRFLPASVFGITLPTGAVLGASGDLSIDTGLFTVMGGFIISMMTAYGLYRKLGPERKKLEAEANRLEAEREKIIQETYKEVVSTVREEVSAYREELANERTRAAEAIQRQAEAQTRVAQTQADLAKVLTDAAKERQLLHKKIGDLELEVEKYKHQLQVQAETHAGEMAEMLRRFEDLRRQLGTPNRRTGETGV